jgi:hypothetical protein
MSISENPATLYQIPDAKISLDARLEMDKSNVQNCILQIQTVSEG